MIFLFPWWDMWVLWRVSFCALCLGSLLKLQQKIDGPIASGNFVEPWSLTYLAPDGFMENFRQNYSLRRMEETSPRNWTSPHLGDLVAANLLSCCFLPARFSGVSHLLHFWSGSPPGEAIGDQRWGGECHFMNVVNPMLNRNPLQLTKYQKFATQSLTKLSQNWVEFR